MSRKQITDKLAELEAQFVAAQAAVLALDVYAAQLRDALKRTHRAIADAAATVTELSLLHADPPPNAGQSARYP
jgi:CHASE2 domain-containing sensor protein